MLGIPIRYLLKHPVTGVADLVADPIETWTTIREAYVEKRCTIGLCPLYPQYRKRSRVRSAKDAADRSMRHQSRGGRLMLQRWPSLFRLSASRTIELSAQRVAPDACALRPASSPADP
jgi:hypothetical protein